MPMTDGSKKPESNRVNSSYSKLFSPHNIGKGAVREEPSPCYLINPLLSEVQTLWGNRFLLQANQKVGINKSVAVL